MAAQAPAFTAPGVKPIPAANRQPDAIAPAKFTVLTALLSGHLTPPPCERGLVVPEFKRAGRGSNEPPIVLDPIDEYSPRREAVTHYSAHYSPSRQRLQTRKAPGQMTCGFTVELRGIEPLASSMPFSRTPFADVQGRPIHPF